MEPITVGTLQIDPGDAAERIKDFIISSCNRDGVVVPISGGLDSSVVAALCVDALGKSRVTLLQLPEKQGNPDAEYYANMLAKHLDITSVRIDISPMLKAFGTYSYILSYFPTRRWKERLVRRFMTSSDGESNYVRVLKGQGDTLIRKGLASFFTKQRVRLVAAYFYAEKHNLQVVGCAHKSEELTGLCVKYGIDDAADMMPIGHLYRTQIIQLAHTLSIPGEILERTPNPDIIPGITDKYQDVLGVTAEEVDLVLYALENQFPESEIAEATGVAEDGVSRIVELYRAAKRNSGHAKKLED
ncbi:MAG TPA: NAD(+) synthase [Sphaerochaeta sp.]|jgi:NAD+ synthase|nr:NAD(+) synthase [Sphaerochaeta sp.]